MKLICTVVLILSLSPTSAQPNPSIPTNTSSLSPTCIASLEDPSLQQSCQEDLNSKIGTTIQYYTEKFAQRFSVCIGDPAQERDATFDFRGNMSFLSKCFYDTQGTILERICSGGEIKAYLSSLVGLIQSSASGEASATIANVNCNENHWSQGCEAGWSKSLQVSVTDMSQLYQNTSVIPLRDDLAIEPCCEGFFCPRGLSCMIPCPLGAQCTKANFTGGLCSPYNYPLTPGESYSCGGANLWASLSVSSGIFCPAGSYCPSTTDVRLCDMGHFCRQGSTTQSKCFQLTSCDEQSTTQHIQTYGLILIVGLVVMLLIIYNCSNQVRYIREKRKAKTRAKAIQQVREHFTAVERWKFAASAVRQLRHTTSGHSRNSEDERVLAPSSMLRSKKAHFRVRSIAEERPDEADNTRERGSDPFYTVDLLEQDLYEPPPVNMLFPGDQEGSSGSRRNIRQTRSQILRYAYGQIEREKAVQNRHMSWNDVLQAVQAGQEQGHSKRLKIEITFQDLSLFLKGNGKKILCNVTGKLSPGRVTAVMGPSGAGKTTFLNALAGKAYNSYTTGLVLINGKPDPIKCYSKIIGFVPQDDIVHGNLTVEENLWFSARYRLPVDMPKSEKVLVVERIIDALGLGHIRNSKVGTVEKRGISGGQRKRVNVGLEMVLEPSLLILDEPTSGLDSTSSQLVLKALRREAFVGVNVGVVLHQPSYGLFRMFDDVMFLAKGGRTVYLGPVDDVEDYFANMGILVPERINPPDHFMDVLEGITKPDVDAQFDAKSLPIKWIQYKGYDVPKDLQASVLEIDAPLEKTNQGVDLQSSRREQKEKSFVEDLWGEFNSFLEIHWDDFKSTFSKLEDLSNRKTPGFWTQFKMIISRLALQRVREARLQTQDYLILLLCGACLGVISPTKDASLGSNSYAYVIIALSLLCMIAALRTFTNEKLQFWRESASGINRVAYFLAKDTVDQFNTVIKPVVFLSMFYFFNNPRSTFVENYIVTLALVYCVTGIAYIFAVTLESGPAQLWSVFLPIIFTLVATKRDLSDMVKIVQYGAYARWALEAYVIANARRYPGVWLITRCAILYGAGYNLNHWALCLSVLFCMGFIARFIALLCLMLCNRSRQQ